jgi:hypothetical protein
MATTPRENGLGGECALCEPISSVGAIREDKESGSLEQGFGAGRETSTWHQTRTYTQVTRSFNRDFGGSGSSHGLTYAHESINIPSL